MEGNALLLIALIILFSKIFSSLFQKINFPPVLAMILIGIIIGPTVLNLVSKPEDLHIIEFFSKIGVIILLFLAGLETDLNEIKSIGKNSFFIALGGVIVPFFTGFFITYFFFHNIYAALILGLILTATSVSVSVMTLMDMGKLRTVEGTTIVNAAIIDDIIGIIILSIVLGFAESQGEIHYIEIFKTIGLILIFFISIFVTGIFIIPLVSNLLSKLNSDIIVTFTFFCMFLFSWYAEKLDIAAITGAYFAGVFIGRLKQKHQIEDKVRGIGHTLFVSIFFVYIGIQTNLRNFDSNLLLFTILFVAGAFISKIFGSGIIAKLLGFDIKRAFRIGSGMVPRGEVALIIASIALTVENNPIIGESEFTTVIFMVIVTAFITPFLLKMGFHEKKLEKEF